MVEGWRGCGLGIRGSGLRLRGEIPGFEVERDLLVKGAWPYKPQPPPVLEPH